MTSALQNDSPPERFARGWLMFFALMVALQLASMAWFHPRAYAASLDSKLLARSILITAGVTALALWSILLDKQARRSGIIIVYACLLVALWCFRPWVGVEYNADAPFDRGRHVDLAAAMAVIGLHMLVLSLLSLRTARRQGAALGLLECAQMLLICIGITAAKHWPGGDDGGMIAWSLFVLSLSTLTVLAGAVGWCMYLARKFHTPSRVVRRS